MLPGSEAITTAQQSAQTYLSNEVNKDNIDGLINDQTRSKQILEGTIGKIIQPLIDSTADFLNNMHFPNQDMDVSESGSQAGSPDKFPIKKVKINRLEIKNHCEAVWNCTDCGSLYMELEKYLDKIKSMVANMSSPIDIQFSDYQYILDMVLMPANFLLGGASLSLNWLNNLVKALKSVVTILLYPYIKDLDNMFVTTRSILINLIVLQIKLESYLQAECIMGCPYTGMEEECPVIKALNGMEDTKITDVPINASINNQLPDVGGLSNSLLPGSNLVDNIDTNQLLPTNNLDNNLVTFMTTKTCPIKEGLQLLLDSIQKLIDGVTAPYEILVSLMDKIPPEFIPLNRVYEFPTKEKILELVGIKKPEPKASDPTVTIKFIDQKGETAENIVVKLDSKEYLIKSGTLTIKPAVPGIYSVYVKQTTRYQQYSGSVFVESNDKEKTEGMTEEQKKQLNDQNYVVELRSKPTVKVKLINDETNEVLIEYAAIIDSKSYKTNTSGEIIIEDVFFKKYKIYTNQDNEYYSMNEDFYIENHPDEQNFVFRVQPRRCLSIKTIMNLPENVNIDLNIKLIDKDSKRNPNLKNSISSPVINNEAVFKDIYPGLYNWLIEESLYVYKMTGGCQYNGEYVNTGKELGLFEGQSIVTDDVSPSILKKYNFIAKGSPMKQVVNIGEIELKNIICLKYKFKGEPVNLTRVFYYGVDKEQNVDENTPRFTSYLRNYIHIVVNEFTTGNKIKLYSPSAYNDMDIDGQTSRVLWKSIKFEELEIDPSLKYQEIDINCSYYGKVFLYPHADQINSNFSRSKCFWDYTNAHDDQPETYSQIYWYNYNKLTEILPEKQVSNFSLTSVEPGGYSYKIDEYNRTSTWINNDLSYKISIAYPSFVYTGAQVTESDENSEPQILTMQKRINDPYIIINMAPLYNLWKFERARIEASPERVLIVQLDANILVQKTTLAQNNIIVNGLYLELKELEKIYDKKNDENNQYVNTWFNDPTDNVSKLKTEISKLNSSLSEYKQQLTGLNSTLVSSQARRSSLNNEYNQLLNLFSSSDSRVKNKKYEIDEIDATIAVTLNNINDCQNSIDTTTSAIQTKSEQLIVELDKEETDPSKKVQKELLQAEQEVKNKKQQIDSYIETYIKPLNTSIDDLEKQLAEAKEVYSKMESALIKINPLFFKIKFDGKQYTSTRGYIDYNDSRSDGLYLVGCFKRGQTYKLEIPAFSYNNIKYKKVDMNVDTFILQQIQIQDVNEETDPPTIYLDTIDVKTITVNLETE